jgi:hypothetical protein
MKEVLCGNEISNILLISALNKTSLGKRGAESALLRHGMKANR